MIFEVLEYLFGEIKMLIYKLFYLGNLKYKLIGKYSDKAQIRLLKKGKLILVNNNLLRSGVKIRVQNGGIVTIGENTGLNYNCIINSHDRITIGKNTTFGQNVKLYDHDHVYKKQGLLRDNGFVTEPIEIGDNVWIGSDCTILKGTVIGSNSVIAAGTVVRGNIPENTLVYQRRDTVYKEIIRT